MSAQEYTIQAVAPQTREWESKFGTMISYKVKFTEVAETVEINQQPTTPAPKAGDKVYGRLEDGKFGPKFKKEQRQQGFGGGQATAPRPGKASSSSFQSDPFTMYLSYAKDIAVALIGTKDGFDEAKFANILENVITGGKTLYNDRPGSETAVKKTVDALPSDDKADKVPTDEDFAAVRDAFPELYNDAPEA